MLVLRLISGALGLVGLLVTVVGVWAQTTSTSAGQATRQAQDRPIHPNRYA